MPQALVGTHICIEHLLPVTDDVLLPFPGFLCLSLPFPPFTLPPCSLLVLALSVLLSFPRPVPSPPLLSLAPCSLLAQPSLSIPSLAFCCSPVAGSPTVLFWIFIFYWTNSMLRTENTSLWTDTLHIMKTFIDIFNKLFDRTARKMGLWTCFILFKI